MFFQCTYANSASRFAPPSTGSAHGRDMWQSPHIISGRKETTSQVVCERTGATGKTSRRRESERERENIRRLHERRVHLEISRCNTIIMTESDPQQHGCIILTLRDSADPGWSRCDDEWKIYFAQCALRAAWHDNFASFFLHLSFQFQSTVAAICDLRSRLFATRRIPSNSRRWRTYRQISVTACHSDRSIAPSKEDTASKAVYYFLFLFCTLIPRTLRSFIRGFRESKLCVRCVRRAWKYD